MSIENTSQEALTNNVLNENIRKNIDNLDEKNLSEFDENLIFYIKNLSEKNELNDEKIKFFGSLFDYVELGEKIFSDFNFDEKNFINAKFSLSDSVDFSVDFEEFYGEGEDLDHYKIANFIFKYKEKNKINPEKNFYNEEGFENYLKENNFDKNNENFEVYLEKFFKENTFIKKFIKNIYQKIQRV